MKTGNTWPCVAVECAVLPPQWSPVMKTGNTCRQEQERYSVACLNGARS